MSVYQLIIAPELLRKLKSAAALAGKTMKAFVIEAIIEKLSRN